MHILFREEGSWVPSLDSMALRTGAEAGEGVIPKAVRVAVPKRRDRGSGRGETENERNWFIHQTEKPEVGA